MTDLNPGNHAHGGANLTGTPTPHRPYWKRAHHDWRFWVAATLIFVCMVVYVLTVEFTVQPRGQAQPMLVVPPAR